LTTCVEHVVLDRGRVAERWSSYRWESLRLLTPNWLSRLPGFRYTGPDFAPGGRPRAWLPRSISGLPITVPIVERRPGWVAVLLPSINRRVGWLTTAGWTRSRQASVRRRRQAPSASSATA
jgi:hypothetical protein